MNIEQLTKALKECIVLNEDMICLSLVSKNEGVIVNELVKYVNKNQINLVAVKEYQRVDVVFFEKEKLLNGEKIIRDLIEFKACYSFDLQKEKSFPYWMGVLKTDFNKEKNNKLLKEYSQVNQYNVLIVTNPLNTVPEQYKGIIKYRTGINTYAKKNIDSHQINTKKIRNYFKEDDYEVMDFKIENTDETCFLGVKIDLSVYVIKKK